MKDRVSATLSFRLIKKTITAYDRDQLANDIEKAIEEHRVLHVDKERAHTLASGRPGSNSLTTMTEDEPKGNIARFWNTVNWGMFFELPTLPKARYTYTLSCGSNHI